LHDCYQTQNIRNSIHLSTHGYKFISIFNYHILSPPLLAEVHVIMNNCYKLKVAYYLKFKLQLKPLENCALLGYYAASSGKAYHYLLHYSPEKRNPPLLRDGSLKSR